MGGIFLMEITPEEKREMIDTLHRLAIATESIARHLFNLNEMLRQVDIPPTGQGQ
jgi:hypothetical protein